MVAGELCRTLGELADRLAVEGHPHWAGWIRRCHGLLERDDGSGLDLLLQAFGGMGSLNDTNVTPETSRLLSLAWEQAEAIRRRRFR
jgi:hypothetical protein